jgi:hypothetical protein
MESVELVHLIDRLKRTFARQPDVLALCEHVTLHKCPVALQPAPVTLPVTSRRQAMSMAQSGCLECERRRKQTLARVRRARQNRSATPGGARPIRHSGVGPPFRRTTEGVSRQRLRAAANSGRYPPVKSKKVLPDFSGLEIQKTTPGLNLKRYWRALARSDRR